jgi:hypothetical protein
VTKKLEIPAEAQLAIFILPHVQHSQGTLKKKKKQRGISV